MSWVSPTPTPMLACAPCNVVRMASNMETDGRPTDAPAPTIAPALAPDPDPTDAAELVVRGLRTTTGVRTVGCGRTSRPA